MLNTEVYKRMIEKQGKMSKSHKKIASYLIDQPEKAPFLTASKLAKKVGVGEATVIRFASYLGFQGYPDFQRSLQKALQRKWTSAEVFAKTTEANEDPKNVLREIVTDDIQNLKVSLNKIDPEVFSSVVTKIRTAKRIYIIAYRSAVSIGSFLEFYLDLVLQNTEMIREADGVSEHLLDIKTDDLVIGLGFARYTKRTVEVLKYCKQKGANTVVITDHFMSPLVPFADHSLVVGTNINSFIDSFAAPFSIVSALITAVTRLEQVKVEKRLEDLEELWENFDVFQQ